MTGRRKAIDGTGILVVTRGLSVVLSLFEGWCKTTSDAVSTSSDFSVSIRGHAGRLFFCKSALPSGVLFCRLLSRHQ